MTIIPKTITAIAWDLDGTLIDSFHIFTKMIRSLAPDFNVPTPSESRMAKEFHGTLRQSIEAVIDGLSAEQFDMLEHRFLSEQDRFYAVVDEHIIREALELMQAAAERGCKQVIVTNRDHAGRGRASPRSIVANSALSGLVDEIICGDEVGEFRKPDARVFGNLLTDWQVTPAELLIIGDQHVDALLALNVGAQGIIVTADGKSMEHTELLPPSWRSTITEVKSLREVGFAG